ncbi:MAG: TonB-dependent receptor [Sphingomonadales bacterium]|nr:TonB-dependent receptor [Sphingomonadales bacterium]
MKKQSLLIAAIFAITAINAQNEQKKINNDTTELESMDEILVSSQRFGSSRANTTRQIEVISAKQMQLAQQGTLADVLSQTGQVFVQKSQLGGGSPVLRGFESSRVLLVVDGVRMNNATYRAGHLQDIITVDQFMLDRTEVFFGSGSTQFGSDALGGVVYMKTRDPKFRDAKFGFANANANFRYHSATSAAISNVNLGLSGKKVAWIFSSTSSDFSDLRMGQQHHFSRWDTFGLRKYYAGRINNRDTMLLNDNPYIQQGSAYTQNDVFTKLSVKTGNLLHTLNAQLSRTGAVPRYDRLTDMSAGKLRFATWDYVPQNRDFFSYSLLVPKKDGLSHRLILSQQNTEVGRVTRRFGNVSELTQLDKVGMTTVNYDFSYNVKPAIQIQGGAEWVANKVQSSATTRNVNSGEITGSKNTRYADGGANTMSSALFANAIYVIRPNDFILEGGVRLTHYQLKANFTADNFLKLPYQTAEISSLAPVYNIGLSKKMDWDGLFFKASLAAGFRNPNVDDMTKLFESVPGGKLVIPNKELKPERTRTLDLGFRLDRQKIHLEMGGYYTRITQLLIDAPGIYNGDDSFDFDGQRTPVFQMGNSALGYVTGGYFAAKIQLVDGLFMDANYNSTFGRYKSGEKELWAPIDHIAPDHGRLGLRWSSKEWQCEAFMLFNGRKIRREYSPSGEDNAQYAPGGQTPAWQTYNARASWQVSKNFAASFAVENLLDLNYRVFASGISASGRNLVASVKVSF